MLNQVSLESLRRIKVQPKTLLAIAISSVFVFSFFHHIVNFWGMAWEKQLLIVALIPVLAVPLNFLIAFVWESAVHISWKRWVLFLLPALMIVSYVTWRVFEFPLLLHSIQITAKENAGRHEIQLLEIRDSTGAVVPFARIDELGDWTVQNKILTTAGTGSRPVYHSFIGPFEHPVKFRFQTSPAAGDIEIEINGQSLQASLFEAQNGQRAIEIYPAYRFGIPGKAINWLVILIDFLAVLSLFAMLWLIQEIHQTSQPSAEAKDIFSRREYWKWLGVLLVIAFGFHAVNYLSVPLLLGEDSPGYLDGAVHWAKYHNLEGASPVRGPGTSVIFLPAILLFGRNPWGLKLLLHLLAFASVALAYHLGWQLNRKYWFAFLAGLLTVLTPDIYLSSNAVMSEVPNLFFVLLFCVLLLTALETLTFRWILATMLVGSFAVLIRTENVVLLVLAVLFFFIRVVQMWSAQRKTVPTKIGIREMAVYAKQIGFASLLAVLPILGWSAHNHQQHGFFGLSNYAAEVFYTGWVYGGEANHVPITDHSSPAVQIINDVYWGSAGVVDGAPVPTGWNIYDRLIEHGYASEDAFALLRQAALDSIANDYRVTWQVIATKIRDSFKPEPGGFATFPLPGETFEPNRIKTIYFDEEDFAIPLLIRIQRNTYEFLDWYYFSIYPIWAWACVGAMLLCLYRKPVIPWLPLVLITLFRVGFPNLFGLSLWRFVIPGFPLMQILALAALHSIFVFARSMFLSHKNNTITVADHQRIS